MARIPGLTPAEIASLTHGHADDPCWTTGRERALIQVADAALMAHIPATVVDTCTLGDPTTVVIKG